MYTLDWFRNKHITVMGLGVHGGGLGVAKWLRRRGARVTVTDLRDQHALASSIDELERTYLQEVRRVGKNNMHRITYVLGKHPDELFTEADMVIQNPAVPRENPLLAKARAAGVPVETDISLFFMLCPYPIAAISGTKGKTTTTVLLSEMCKRVNRQSVVGGNIRISPLDKLDALIKSANAEGARLIKAHARGKAVKVGKPTPVVLELSSWQLEGLAPHKRSPHVGVLTMIAEDHLNRYHGMADYAGAKEIIVAYQQAGDTAVLNYDNDWNRAIGERRAALAREPHAGRRLWYSVNKLPAKLDGCFVDGRSIVLRVGGIRTVVAPVKSIGLPGPHNVSNVLAATAAAVAYGVPLKDVRFVIRNLKSVPYRLETVAVKKGIRFVNDTAATAPDASIAAMAAFSGGTSRARKPNVILIAGGADKDLNFGPWAEAVRKAKLKHLVLFDAPSTTATVKMETALHALGDTTPCAGARSMREAFGEAMRHAVKGDVILLSPGCASFGIFKNEFDRGDQFNAAVKRVR